MCDMEVAVVCFFFFFFHSFSAVSSLRESAKNKKCFFLRLPRSQRGYEREKKGLGEERKGNWMYKKKTIKKGEGIGGGNCFVFQITK